MKRIILMSMLSFVVLSMYAQSCPDSNHPHVIDLGLPSGTKWACCNAGASSPSGYGGYFSFNDETFKVIRSMWGGSWFMPSENQFRELVNNCNANWTTINGVEGYKFTGNNGKSIFFPAAGYRYRSDSSINDTGSGGYYCGYIPYENHSEGIYLGFTKGDAHLYSAWEGYEYSIRFVRK